jgi:hypothetical protein
MFFLTYALSVPQINKSTALQLRWKVKLQRHTRNLSALLIAGMAQWLRGDDAHGVNFWNYVE